MLNIKDIPAARQILYETYDYEWKSGQVSSYDMTRHMTVEMRLQTFLITDQTIPDLEEDKERARKTRW